MGTARVILIGDPVDHSLSPALQNAAFRASAIDASYEAERVTVHDLRSRLNALRDEPYLGANVTLPHKEAVLRLVDTSSVEVLRIGAANTIVRRGHALHGENTDGHGFRSALAERGVAVAGARVLVLGAGGAARACVVELLRDGARVAVASRGRARLDRLMADLAPGGGELRAIPWPASLEGTDIVVNATPLGLHGEDPLHAVALPSSLVVFDLVPVAASTPLIERAGLAGCEIVDGLLMLLHQAAASFRLWTGREPPLEVMRAALPRQV